MPNPPSPVLSGAVALALLSGPAWADAAAPAGDPPRAALAPHAAEPPALRAVPLQPGERLVLDGTLSHPAWQRAPVFDRFVEFQPQRGGPPPQSTRVQMLFDAQALYVGITALDTEPARIRDPIVRHDQVNRTQDFVVVYVDAIGLRQSAQFFRVNAAGSLGDGLHTAADDSEDFDPDFDWDARVARTAQGWTTVLRLPFASLRYAAGSEHAEAPWRVMVARRLPREQFHLVMSAHLPREAASFIGQLQRLEGLRLPERHAFLSLRPSVTWRATRDTPAGGPTRREQELEASLDLKWRPRAELVVDAALNPDFSQVAIDVPQLAGNTRFALSLPEKRPFFFEGRDLLRSPTEAFYTRSFTAPRWGLRSTWRGADVAGSAFALDDRGGGLVLRPEAFGTGAASQPASRVLAARGLWEVGAARLGGLAVQRRYEDDRGDNTVLGPDLGWQLSETLRLRAQWLHSRTTATGTAPDADGDGLPELARGGARDGDRVFAKLFHQGQLTEANLSLDQSGAGFRHDSGFVNQVGVRRVAGFAATGWERLGPFNEFWLNLEGEHVADRASGRRVSAGLWPGLWASAARNVEWTLQWRGLQTLRTAPASPLLHERYWHTQLVMTPAAWAPLLDATLDLGRLADTADDTVRRGGRANVLLKLRPARRLELEPTLYTAWLRGDGGLVYRESSAQLLAIWHLDALSHLRLIAQRYSFSRPGQRATDDAGSLTFAHRWSPGTLLYVGATRTRQGPPDAGGLRPRGAELFVKLQVDADDLRRAF